MLRQGLILTSHREYAHSMRVALMSLGDLQTRVDVELDALRAMQLVPQQYELILLDAMLDAMDGMQLLLLMKQQSPGSTFVLVSDALDEVSRAQAYRNGADFYVVRPGTPEEFGRTLREIEGLLKTTPQDPRSAEDLDGPLTQLTDSVQTHCLSGDSVLLVVRSVQESGDIFIHRGEVFHAQYPGRSGKLAFHDMLQWDGGQVRIKSFALNHVPPRTIEISYRELLEMAVTTGAMGPDNRPRTGALHRVQAEPPLGVQVPSVMLEAPPLDEELIAPVPEISELEVDEGGTRLPPINAHWKVNLMGELVEGSQVAEPDRCAFITYFIYRKLADIAVALEVDYFDNLTLTGPHLQQVLVADNLGVRHAVFDAARTDESEREQYVKWCCEQSF